MLDFREKRLVFTVVFSISPSSFPGFVHIFGRAWHPVSSRRNLQQRASHPFASSSRQWCSLDPNFQRSNTRPTWWPAIWRSTSPSATTWSIQWAFFLLGEVEVPVDNSIIKAAFVYVWHVTHTHTHKQITNQTYANIFLYLRCKCSRSNGQSDVMMSCFTNKPEMFMLIFEDMPAF